MTLLRRPAFLRDAERIYRFIARDNLDAARRFLIAAEESCEQIFHEPGIGIEEKFRKRAGVRSWRIRGFENFLIFYRINPDSLEVLRVLHGARDLPRHFRNEG